MDSHILSPITNTTGLRSQQQLPDKLSHQEMAQQLSHQEVASLDRYHLSRIFEASTSCWTPWTCKVAQGHFLYGVFLPKQPFDCMCAQYSSAQYCCIALPKYEPGFTCLPSNIPSNARCMQGNTLVCMSQWQCAPCKDACSLLIHIHKNTPPPRWNSSKTTCSEAHTQH